MLLTDVMDSREPTTMNQVVKFPTCIREVSDWNPGRSTYYPDRVPVVTPRLSR
jgi:hypothetical protein